MKVLVTGREGQLARALGEKALGFPSLEVTFAARPELDLAVRGSVSRLIADNRPDLVINAAGYTAVDKAETERELAFRINAQGAGEVAAAAREVRAAVIQLSTDYVFDGASDVPYREDAPTAPLNIYGASKLAGEEAVRAANPDHLIVRTSWVYSPFGANFVRTMLRLAAEREEIRVVDDQVGGPTSALDLADALLGVAERIGSGDRGALGATFHLAGQGSCSWAVFAAEIFRRSAELGGPAASVVPISTEEFPTAAERPRHSLLDCSRFEREFGSAMPDWRESVAKVVGRLVESG